MPFTSRPRRKDEISGRDYHYVSKEEFRDLIVSNQLFEWDYTLRNYYGCPNSIVQMAESTSPTIMHALARMAVRIAVRLPCVSLVFLSSHSQATLSERLALRNYSDMDAVLRREHWREEEEHSRMFDLVVQDAEKMSEDGATRMLQSLIDEPGSNWRTPAV